MDHHTAKHPMINSTRKVNLRFMQIHLELEKIICEREKKLETLTALIQGQRINRAVAGRIYV